MQAVGRASCLAVITGSVSRSTEGAMVSSTATTWVMKMIAAAVRLLQYLSHWYRNAHSRPFKGIYFTVSERGYNNSWLYLWNFRTYSDLRRLIRIRLISQTWWFITSYGNEWLMIFHTMPHCSYGSLVTASDVSFMWILFAGFLRKGRVKWQCGGQKRRLSVLLITVCSEPPEIRPKITISAFTDCEIDDLEWPWIAI